MSQSTEAVREVASEAYADHRQWQRDVECWNNDIRQWRREHSAAIAQLQHALRCVNDHDDWLDEHADSVASLEGKLRHHKKSLLASQRNGLESDLDDMLSDLHCRQANLHHRQQQVHDQIRKRHQDAMAQVAALKSALKATI